MSVVRIDSRKQRRRPVPCIAAALVLLVLGADSASGQQYRLTRYTAAEGLPSGRVLSLAQDSTGYIWVGTDAGLGRYDGATFVALPQVAGVPGQQVQALAAVPAGMVFATREGGLGVIGAEGRRPLTEVDAGGPVHEIRVEPTGGLLVAGPGGVRELRGEARSPVAGPPPNGCCVTAWRDERGRIWAGGSAGLFRVMGNEFQPVRGGFASGAEITVLLGDENGELWVGTTRGLYRMNDDRAETVGNTTRVSVTSAARRGSELWFGTTRGAVRVMDGRLEELGRPAGLGDAPVNAVMVDREGSVWFGTDNGVVKWVGAPFVGFTRAQGLPDDFVVAVAPAGDEILVATRNGVVRGDGDGEFRRELTVDPPGSEEVTAATLSGERLVVGTRRGLIVRERPGGSSAIVPSEPVAALLTIGDAVVAGTSSGLFRLAGRDLQRIAGPPDGLAFAALAADVASGALWAIADDGSVWVGTTESVSQLSIELEGQAAVVVDVDVDGGEAWLATRGQGVVKIGTDRSLSRLTRAANGLASDQVRAVLAAADGAVWSCTTWGLDFWSPEQGITHYGLAAGLPALGCNPGAAVRDGKGRAWFGTPQGLATRQNEAAAVRSQPPVVVITSASVSGTARDPARPFSLSAEEADLTFGFSALAFRDEASTRFQYRLLGQTELWSRPTAARSVSYASLGAGQYIFEVQAIGEAGLWSLTPARVQFTVLPRPWETPWFRGAVSLLALLVVGGLFWRRLRVVEGERQALRSMVDKRTRELVEKNALLERMATTDELTGLPNRRFFLDTMQRELRKLTRISTDQQLSLLVIDLDRFKSVNDRYGHNTGDAVLRQVAGRLAQAVRATDLPARYGGEEFAILLPDTGQQGAGFLGEKLRAEVEAAPVRHEGVTVPVTISVGVATIDAPKRYGPEIEADLIRRADEAMYEAKTGGRNRVVVAPMPQSESDSE